MRFGQGHHIRHWAQGGPTTLSNLTMLCRRHHRAVHEEGYQVDRDHHGELRFRRPDGRLLPDVPRPSTVPADAVSVLRAQNHVQGAVPDARTAIPFWRGERLDVGYAIDVLHPSARGDSHDRSRPSQRDRVDDDAGPQFPMIFAASPMSRTMCSPVLARSAK